MKMTVASISKAISDARVSKKRLEFRDDDHPGLNLGISPHGVATWSLRVRDREGNLRRFSIGRHCDLTISAARKKARSLRVDVEAGADPILEKRRSRAFGADLRAGKGTLLALLDLYETQGDPPKTWFTGAGRKRIERVFRPVLPQSAKNMKSTDLVAAIDAYDGSKEAAKNALRALKPVLSWAAQREHVPPGLLLVKPGGGVGTRDRVLTNDELKRLLPVLRRWKTAHGPAMLFMLLTLARRSEVDGLTWSEINLETQTWILPADRQKNTRNRRRKMHDLLIPLSPPAMRILRELHQSAPPPTAFVFSGSRGSRLSNWDREQKRIFEASATSGWHRHDLRRTGASLLGELDISPHIVSAALNHMVIFDKLQSNYNKSRYNKAVREAMKKLGGCLYRLAEVTSIEPDEYGDPEMVWTSVL